MNSKGKQVEKSESTNGGKFYNKWWFWVIIFLIAAVAGFTKGYIDGKLDSEQEGTEEVNENTDEANEAEVDQTEDLESDEISEVDEVKDIIDQSLSEEEPIEETESQVDLDSMTQEEKEDFTYEMLLNSYEGIADVKFDRENKVFEIEPYEFNEALDGIVDKDEETLNEWREIKEVFPVLSGTLVDIVGEGYSLNLSSSFHDSHILLRYIDGELIENNVD